MAAEFDTAEALKFWHDTHLALVHDSEHDLSSRQVTILLTVYLEPPPHTVRGLAEKLGVTKPVITRALDTMGRLDLLNRRRDQNDKRNVLVQRTVTGALFVEELADTISRKAEEL